jgi:hypothetical protein
MFVTWYYFQHYPFSWISFTRNFSQSASISVARHNGSYAGGPIKFSALLISVRTDVLLGKRNDFLKGFQVSPPCPSKSSKKMKKSVEQWRNENPSKSEKGLCQSNFYAPQILHRLERDTTPTYCVSTSIHDFGYYLAGNNRHIFWEFVFVAMRPNEGHGCPVFGLLRSYTNNNAPQSVGILWTSDQLVAETSTWQHTTLTTDRHQCPRRDSNRQAQQASGWRPTPYTARPLGPTFWGSMKYINTPCGQTEGFWPLQQVV